MLFLSNTYIGKFLFKLTLSYSNKNKNKGNLELSALGYERTKLAGNLFFQVESKVGVNNKNVIQTVLKQFYKVERMPVVFFFAIWTCFCQDNLIHTYIQILWKPS